MVKGTELAKFKKKSLNPQSLICFSHSPIQFRLFPLKELYFNKVVSSASGFFLRGNKEHVIVLSVVACMLLLVGIFNFINIYTVIILKRAREFGVKKVYGASGIQVFSQILCRKSMYGCYFNADYMDADRGYSRVYLHVYSIPVNWTKV